jgi:hypothetical protein
MTLPSPTLHKGWPLSSYRPSLLEYTFEESHGCLRHNFERDLQMFVLWEHARPAWDRILDDLALRFEIIHVRHITWPESDVDDNFLRLYGSAPLADGAGPEKFKRRDIVGSGTFTLVVVEDRRPHYVIDRTYSRKVEVVNRSVVEAKAAYRAWTEGGFRVHSSNSLGEFFRDMTLLVGAEDLDHLLTTTARSRIPQAVRASLAGADGWRDMAHLFRHLNRAARYVVLRNFDHLPHQLDEGDADIDALCDTPAEIAAIANARVVAERAAKFACRTRVAGNDLCFDLRYPGDGYFDAGWQAQVLRSAIDRNGVMIPSRPDQFFTLLYHAKVHKPSMKPVYATRLRDHAESLGLRHYADLNLASDEVAADLLGGYMAGRRYRVELPLDPWVHLNGPFVTRLRSHGLLWEQERVVTEQRMAVVLARMPGLWRWHRFLTRFAAGLYRRFTSWVSVR